MAKKKRDKYADSVSITSPISGEEFYGDSSGEYSPLGGTVDTYFWSGPSTPNTNGADVHDNAVVLSTKANGTLTWFSTIDVRGFGQSLTAALRAVSGADQKESINLKINSADSLTASAKVQGGRKRIKITTPKNGDKLGYLFYVSGECVNMANRDYVDIQVLGKSGPLKTVITRIPILCSPTHPTICYWSFVVLAFKSFSGALVRARLFDGKGNVLSAHSVSQLDIGY